MALFSLDVISVCILCVCQLVADVSTHADLARGNNLSPTQETLTNNNDDQRYDDGPSADNARLHGGLRDVLSLAGSKDQYPLDRKKQSLEQRDHQGMDSMPAITSNRSRNRDMQDVGVSEANDHQKISTTTPTTSTTSRRQLPRKSVSSLQRSLNTGHLVVSETRQSSELYNFQKLSSSFQQTVVQNKSTEDTDISSKSPHPSVLEVRSDHKGMSRTDVRFVNKVDDGRKDDNSTLLQPESVTSQQLPHTNISAASHNMADIKRVEFLPETRQSNNTDTETLPRPVTVTSTRQPHNTEKATYIRPVTVLRTKQSNNTATAHHPRPDTVTRNKQSNNRATEHHLRPVTDSWTKQSNNTLAAHDLRPVTASWTKQSNNTLAAHHLRPVTASWTKQSNSTVTAHHLRLDTVTRAKQSNNRATEHHPRPVTASWTTQSNNADTELHRRAGSRHQKLHVRTQTQSPVFLAGVTKDYVNATTKPQRNAEPGTRAQLAEAQPEDKGQLQHEDVDEEVRNDTSTCTTCSKSVLTEGEVKAIRLDMFKELLAKKMRIDINVMNTDGALNDHQPNKAQPQLPQVIVERTIKANVDESERDQFYARDREIIIAGKDLGRECPRSDITGCYRFPIRDKVKLAVADARLWFYKQKDPSDDEGQSFRVINFHNFNTSRYQYGREIAAKDGLKIQEGWIQMNVTEEVHKWLDNGIEAPVLAIRCPTCKAKSYTSIFRVKQGYKPLLVLKYFANNHVTRDKRSRACDPVSECCKRDLVVNFHDISMVEILEPRTLAIGYCYGSCNEAHQFAYNYTSLKHRVRLSSSYSTQPTMTEQLRACCVPLVLKDTFIMTIEGDDCVTKVVPKVIVESCGCV